MIPDSSLLGELWLAVAAHLWQTTLVLLPLFLLARAMRSAPARLVNGLWTIGLVKVLLPLARRTVLPLLERVIPSVFGGGGSSAWLGHAYAVIDPTVLAVSGQSSGRWFGAALPGLLTGAWMGGAIYLGVRWARQRQAGGFVEAVSVAGVREELGHRVAEALKETGVPLGVIRIVSGSAMPAVEGVLRRRIMISEAMIAELTTPELRAVLLHENEHRRRFDPLRSVIQRCALAVFFYYPLLWVVLGRLASSCEIACDEAAVDGGVTPRAYARALARTVNIGLLPSCSPAGIGTPRSSLLHQRLSRLSHNGRYVTMMRHRLALSAAVAFVLAVSLLPLPPLAGTEGEDKEVKTSTPPEKAMEVNMEVGDKDLTQPPKLVKGSYVLPEYPEVARKGGIGGEVLLDVTVKKDGSVGAVALKQGVPECPALDKSAEEAVRKWKFEPATEAGTPIEMTIVIPVRFRLDGKEKPLGVESPPELIDQPTIKPVYPEDARKAGISGKVVLEVQVKKDGSTGKIEVTEGVEGYPSLSESAIEALSTWKFKPATRDGKPIDMTIAIPVAFRLDDTK
ncbi:MAG: M56 family metallopeptidase [Candidatus Eisenbacteria bacterium]